MKVKECMCTQVSCVNPDTKIKDVAKLMLNKHIGCVPICDNNNQVVGLVTDRDLILRTVAKEKDIAQTPVSEVMTTKVYNISPEAEIEEASKIMCDCQIRRVPVVDNNTIVGDGGFMDYEVIKDLNDRTIYLCNFLSGSNKCKYVMIVPKVSDKVQVLLALMESNQVNKVGEMPFLNDKAVVIPLLSDDVVKFLKTSDSFDWAIRYLGGFFNNSMKLFNLIFSIFVL